MLWAGTKAVAAEMLFTGNGLAEASFSLDQERDAERDEGVGGLEEAIDLYAGIGVLGRGRLRCHVFSRHAFV